jgi:alpha-ketoglutarate-dependent taurine dioxygenase
MLTEQDLHKFRTISYPRDEKYLDFDLEEYKVTIANLEEENIKSILLPKFIQKGLCFVSCPDLKIENLEKLVPNFGESCNQGKSNLKADNVNYFVIETVEGSKISGLTNKDQAMHVDGFYGRKLPGVMLLHCASQAEFGGESILSDGLAAYKYLKSHYPDELQALMYPEVLEFEFLVGENKAKLPIFNKLENGKIEFFYTPYTKTVQGTSQAENGYKIVSDFIHTPKNQIKYKLREDEFMLLDNTRYTHGRLSFHSKKHRQMNRIWYKGDLSYLGFKVE